MPAKQAISIGTAARSQRPYHIQPSSTRQARGTIRMGAAGEGFERQGSMLDRLKEQIPVSLATDRFGEEQDDVVEQAAAGQPVRVPSSSDLPHRRRCAEAAWRPDRTSWFIFNVPYRHCAGCYRPFAASSGSSAGGCQKTGTRRSDACCVATLTEAGVCCRRQQHCHHSLVDGEVSRNVLLVGPSEAHRPTDVAGITCHQRMHLCA